jgi:hypothetical protein
VDFAQFLREHWSAYVNAARGLIPARAWAAVEAVLSCRTPRRGGSVHQCGPCQRSYYLYHSCNHRACPRCGGADAAQWTRRQEARLLPVPYYLLTITVPEQLRHAFLRFPRELYPALFAASATAVRELAAKPKHLGGQVGFISVLHTWTRRMLHHPHIHTLIPAVGLHPGGCALRHPRHEDYLIPHKALARATRDSLRASLAAEHPALLAQIPAAVWQMKWVAQCQQAGRGRAALRYLAAYVKKTAFSQDRLEGFDSRGRVILRYRDSADDQIKREALEPLELIRRWLLHVLPKGLVRVRHYGWLSPAAHKAFLRVRFLLGLGPQRVPAPPPGEPPRCPHCQGILTLLGKLHPLRGPPLSRLILCPSP